MKKDIEKAIRIERQYLEFRRKGEEPFHLIDAIKECGFESLSEYFQAIKKEPFDGLEFEFFEMNPSVDMPKFFNLFMKQKTFVIFANSDTPFVFLGENTDIDSCYCNENNITIVPINTTGGAIVSLAGDFSFALCCPSSIVDNTKYILDKSKDILQKYTDKTVVVDGNDILVNGKKVCGTAHYNINDYFIFVGYFSFNDKADLISNICKTTKIGKDVGYIDFISRDKLRQEVAEWLQVPLS